MKKSDLTAEEKKGILATLSEMQGPVEGLKSEVRPERWPLVAFIMMQRLMGIIAEDREFPRYDGEEMIKLCEESRKEEGGD